MLAARLKPISAPSATSNVLPGDAVLGAMFNDVFHFLFRVAGFVDHFDIPGVVVAEKLRVHVIATGAMGAIADIDYRHLHWAHLL
jgi:hypothetical protein